MISCRLLAWSLCAALAACAQPPRTEPAPEAGDKSKPKPVPRVVAAKPEPRASPLPEVELSEQLLFKMMLAEVAVQRGQPHVAVPAYLELARETRDPRIAQRATEVAWNARFMSAALEAAGIWLQADPESMQARQVLATLLVNQAQLAEAQPHLEKWLAADRGNLGQSFLQSCRGLSWAKPAPASPYSPAMTIHPTALGASGWSTPTKPVEKDSAR